MTRAKLLPATLITLAMTASLAHASNGAMALIQLGQIKANTSSDTVQDKPGTPSLTVKK